MARPRIEIDWEKFDKLCVIQCTLEEIAGFFDCDTRTIERAVRREHKTSFAEYFNRKRQGGIISIRRAMFQQAVEKGNVALLIYLDKKLCGGLPPKDELPPPPAAPTGDEELRAAITSEQLRQTLLRDAFSDIEALYNEAKALRERDVTPAPAPALPPGGAIEVEDPFK